MFLMKYRKIIPAVFLSRPNRFIARVLIDGKEKLLVNMDSQLPNAVAAEWIKKSGIFSENALIKREVTYGKSRFDIYV